MRLLIPFLSNHLNTNFDNTKIFHRKLVVVAVRHFQALTSEGGIGQTEVRVIRFPSGANLVSASVDAPCAVICGGPRFLWLPDAVYIMIMHHCILWPLSLR